MKRKSLGSYLSVFFKMPAMRRTDLTEIEQVIVNDLHPEHYEIACFGFAHDRVEDISQDSGNALTLVVTTRNPGLRLKFARSWAELYCEQNSPQIEPMIKRIQEIVSRRQRSQMWHFTRVSVWLAPIVGFSIFTLVLLLVAAGVLERKVLYTGYAVLMVSWAIWAWSYWMSVQRFSHIELGVTDEI